MKKYLLILAFAICAALPARAAQGIKDLTLAGTSTFAGTIANSAVETWLSGSSATFASGSTLTLSGTTILTAMADPGSPSAGQFWLSTTTANTLKYRSGGTTFSILTTATGQPLDDDLTAIAALSTTATGRALLTYSAASGDMVYYNGTAWTQIASTANGRSLLSVTTLSATGLGLTNGAAIDALAAVASNGLLARTASNTYTARTLTGTSNEITVTNGDGVSGAPTISLPSALTFTGKTVTGGTFNSGAFNGTLGATTPSTIAATTISASGQITSTVTTGTAPFVVASTTAVSNLNASLLLGSTWASPAAIGTGTPAAGTFTTLTAASLTSSSALALNASGNVTINTTNGATLAATFSGTRLTQPGGTIITGTIGSSGTVARSDASIELQGGSSPLLSFFVTRNPGTVGSDEGGIPFSGYDSSGTSWKWASISAKAVVVTAGSTEGVVRINPTYQGADSVNARFFGNQGIEFFGSSDTVGPGSKIFKITGATPGSDTKGSVYATGAVAQGTAPTTSYGFEGAFTGTALVSTLIPDHSFRAGSGSKGIDLGHDSATQRGVIFSRGGTSGITFVTHNGSSWAERLAIGTDGNVSTLNSANLTVAGTLTVSGTGTSTVAGPLTVTSSTEADLHITKTGTSASDLYFANGGAGSLGFVLYDSTNSRNVLGYNATTNNWRVLTSTVSIDGVTTLSSATPSTNTSTGALVLSGSGAGMGMPGNLNVGGTGTFGNTLTVSTGGSQITGTTSTFINSSTFVIAGATTGTATGTFKLLGANSDSSGLFMTAVNSTDTATVLQTASGGKLRLGGNNAYMLELASSGATFTSSITMSAGTLTLTGYGSGSGAVSVGATDSGGSGFKLLRVPN